MEIFLNTPNIFESSDNINTLEGELFFNENINPAYEQCVQQPPSDSKSKFPKKVKDVSDFSSYYPGSTEGMNKRIILKPVSNFKLNMKINIPSQPIVSSFVVSPNVLEPSQKFIPGTESMYNQFIESIPTPQFQLDIDTDAQPPNFDLLDQHFGGDVNFEKLILGCTETPQISEENLPFKQPEINAVPSDHEYSSKRKFSVCSVEDSLDSSVASSVFADSFSSSFLPAKRQRNQRPRGIYRADDVTNDEELKNYLERRKKNNISSKISRANKKKNFSEMDLKCNELENNNLHLEKKIVELEKLTKVIKDYLVQKFTENKV